MKFKIKLQNQLVTRNIFITYNSIQKRSHPELITTTVYTPHCPHGPIWNRIIYNRNIASE